MSTKQLQQVTYGEFCLELFLTIHVIVNCTWSDWTWDSCSKSCGNGTQNATRTIAEPAAHGGIACTGPSSDTRSCNPDVCPPKPGEGKYFDNQVQDSYKYLPTAELLD